MTRKPSSIRYIPGRRDLLVVSPHGQAINGAFENDVCTGIIAEKSQQELECYTILRCQGQG